MNISTSNFKKSLIYNNDFSILKFLFVLYYFLSPTFVMAIDFFSNQVIHRYAKLENVKYDLKGNGNIVVVDKIIYNGNEILICNEKDIEKISSRLSNGCLEKGHFIKLSLNSNNQPETIIFSGPLHIEKHILRYNDKKQVIEIKNYIEECMSDIDCLHESKIIYENDKIKTIYHKFFTAKRSSNDFKIDETIGEDWETYYYDTKFNLIKIQDYMKKDNIVLETGYSEYEYWPDGLTKKITEHLYNTNLGKIGLVCSQEFEYDDNGKKITVQLSYNTGTRKIAIYTYSSINNENKLRPGIYGGFSIY